MTSIRLWFARFITLYAVLIFSFLAWLFIAEPLQHLSPFGISASGLPESLGFVRTGPGALFAGLALTAAYGLVKPAQLPASLWVILVFNACIVAARLLGIVVDGATQIQLTELRDEGLSWILFVLAWLAVRPPPMERS